jgi:hypothetical protein
VNDIGTLGGFALVLLMLVFSFSLAREHENLHLAFYKIRRLHEEAHAEAEGQDPRLNGDSRANLLYHALAMTQVLSSPPTLVRWQTRGFLHKVRLAYFFPAIVYAWVWYTNIQTRSVGAQYHNETSIKWFMAIQTVILLVMIFLTIHAWLQASAMDWRWQSMFTMVNRNRQYLPQMEWWEWLKLDRWAWSKRWLHSTPTKGGLQSDGASSRGFRASARREIFDCLEVNSTTKSDHTRVVFDYPVQLPLKRKEIDGFLNAFTDRAQSAAELWCKAHNLRLVRLSRFVPDTGAIECTTEARKGSGRWEINGSVYFEYSEK